MASNGGGGDGDDPLLVGDESDDSYDPQYEEEDDGDEYSDEGSPEDLTLRIDEAMAPGEALLDEMMGPLRHSLAEQERSGEGRVMAQLMSEEEEEEEEEEDEERGGGEVGVSEVGSSEGRRMRVEDETAVWEYEADCSVCMEPWTEEGRHQSW